MKWRACVLLTALITQSKQGTEVQTSLQEGKYCLDVRATLQDMAEWVNKLPNNYKKGPESTLKERFAAEDVRIALKKHFTEHLRIMKDNREYKSGPKAKNWIFELDLSSYNVEPQRNHNKYVHQFFDNWERAKSNSSQESNSSHQISDNYPPDSPNRIDVLIIYERDNKDSQKQVLELRDKLKTEKLNVTEL